MSKVVIASNASKMWNTVSGRLYNVLKTYFHNGESWYELMDSVTQEVIEVPTVFFI